MCIHGKNKTCDYCSENADINICKDRQNQMKTSEEQIEKYFRIVFRNSPSRDFAVGLYRQGLISFQFMQILSR